MHGVEPDEAQQPIETNAGEQSPIFAGWSVVGDTAVSAISIGSWVNRRMAAMVGPNREANSTTVCSSIRPGRPSHVLPPATRSG